MISNNPIISVIIPAFNSEKTIKKTINSVLKQSFKNWELIIIDDDSEDSTVDIISQFNDNRIKLFSYEHGGGNISRNRGFSHANGEFVSFLDSDDIWTSDKLFKQLKALQKNPDAAVVYSWTNYIDENDNFLVSGTHNSFNGDVYEELLISNFLENGSNPLIRRTAFIDVNGFDESLKAGQDWDMWLRLAAKYNFVAVESTQILYRVNSNSVSSNLARQEKACLQVLKKAYKNRKPVSNTWNLSLKNIYKYLTCKALQEPYNYQRGWIALRFLYNYFIHDPARLNNSKFIIILLLKSIIVCIAPNLLAMKKRRNFYYKLIPFVNSSGIFSKN
ncbi:MAG: glycosyltransferase [Cyanobacteria bacterium P01_A01_bin.45]